MTDNRKRFRHRVTGVVVVADPATAATMGSEWETEADKPAKGTAAKTAAKAADDDKK